MATMVCPHCSKEIVKEKAVPKASQNYLKDVRKAEVAIQILGRVPYPELREACLMEAERLFKAIENPAMLYKIYRRGDKKTPIAYGMEEHESQS